MAKTVQAKTKNVVASAPPSKAAQALSKADIILMFGPLQNGVSEDYYKIKMGVWMQAYFPGIPLTDTELVKTAQLTLTGKENLPPVTKVLQKNIDCLLETADDLFPFLPNEYIVEDFVTTLVNPEEEIPAGTVVLQRITNFATLYYVVKNVRMEGSQAMMQTVHFEQEIELQLQSSNDLNVGEWISSLPLKLAKGIGSGMVSGLGGFIAKAILESIFPPGVPNYFDQVYKEMTRIVNQKIDQNLISTINGAISNLIDKLANEYKPAKEVSNLNSKEDRRRLYELLQKYDQTFLSGPGGMLGTLQQDDISKAGFSVFMLGAALQLSIFQEMANIDPFNGNEKDGWKSPLQSSYGLPKTGSVARMAKNYAESATKIWGKVVEARKELVKPERFEKRLQKRGKNKYATLLNVYYYVRVQDDGAATNIEMEIGPGEKGKNPLYDQFCNNQLVAYKNQKAKELSDKLENPSAIIAGWLTLVEKPILV